MNSGAEIARYARIELKAEDLGKAFGFRKVLKGINLQVHSGEVLAVTGENGSGKSTLLRVLAGLQRASRGSVWMEGDGKRLNPVERRCASALAAPAINPYHHLSLRENVQFVTRARGLSGRDGAEELAEQVGLADRLDDLVGSFSSGMIQRTRLALALATRAEALFLDEPTQCLDDAGREVVSRVVGMQRGRGICIIATNDRFDASLADRNIDLGSRN